MEKAHEKKTALPVSLMVPGFLLLMYCVPAALSLAPLLWVESGTAKLALLAIAPVSFALGFVILSAALSLPFQKAIVSGKFPRELTHFVYGPRRLYGLCWGAVFYFTPVYYTLLSVPFLRKSFFWAFGYRGHSDINVAPDAWIRDLPLLALGRKSYIANKATMGTNICLADGSVLVDRITLGDGAMVGHLAMVAPGGVLGERVEIGVGCAIGIRVKIGAKTRIGPTCTINHGAQLGESVDIGTKSYVGLKAVIGDRIKLPGGSNIPDGAQILNQEEVRRYISSETDALHDLREKMSEIYRSRTNENETLSQKTSTYEQSQRRK